jgi:hypothetical protein
MENYTVYKGYVVECIETETGKFLYKYLDSYNTYAMSMPKYSSAEAALNGAKSKIDKELAL